MEKLPPQVTYHNIKWDFVFFDFYDDISCSIRLINSNSYRLSKDYARFENKTFNEIFDDNVEQYD